MTRLLTCLLCLFGLSIPTVAQDGPARSTKTVKPASDLQNQPAAKTRVRVRIVGEDKNGGKREPKASRVGVTVDRPVVSERRIVVQSGTPGFRIGVQLAPVPPALQAQLGLKPGQALMINSVIPGSPAAARKTLRPFDILVGVNGKSPANHEVLTRAVQASGKQKQPVKLTVIRSGKKTTVEITPAAETRAITDNSLEEIDEALHGLQIEGAVNLDELKKKIRILVGKDGQKGLELHFDSDGKDGQKRFELHLDSEGKNGKGKDGQKRFDFHFNFEGKDGKEGRFTRSIRISPEGVVVTRRQPATTRKPGQEDDPGDAAPRIRLQLGRSTDDQAPGSDALLEKLKATLIRIEQLETTVKELRKQVDKKEK